MASVALGFIGFVFGIWLFWDVTSASGTLGGALLSAAVGIGFAMPDGLLMLAPSPPPANGQSAQLDLVLESRG